MVAIISAKNLTEVVVANLSALGFPLHHFFAKLKDILICKPPQRTDNMYVHVHTYYLFFVVSQVLMNQHECFLISKL